MENKLKNIIQTIIFISILFVIFILNLIKEDEKISISERRTLASFPSIENGVSEFGENFDKYATDQFIFRDFFRKIKTNYEFKILRKRDYNNLFIYNNSIYKMEYPLKENMIKKAAEKINSINEKYLNNMNCYYAIIPDKTFYLKNKSEYLFLEHEKLVDIMKENVRNVKYIEISDCFNEESYYRTDLHIKQEEYQYAVNRISEQMGKNIIDFSKFEKRKITNFYGAYYGQIMREIEADGIYCLIDENTENSFTYNYENKQRKEVYDLEKINSNDLYDIFLSGAVPIIDIHNEKVNNGKELIIFRDSFASALAPLLLSNYSKITLIDIRYISSDSLAEYITFENQDVLFLYNDLILNNSLLLK